MGLFVCLPPAADVTLFLAPPGTTWQSSALGLGTTTAECPNPGHASTKARRQKTGHVMPTRQCQTVHSPLLQTVAGARNRTGASDTQLSRPLGRTRHLKWYVWWYVDTRGVL